MQAWCISEHELTRMIQQLSGALLSMNSLLFTPKHHLHELRLRLVTVMNSFAQLFLCNKAAKLLLVHIQIRGTVVDCFTLMPPARTIS